MINQDCKAYIEYDYRGEQQRYKYRGERYRYNRDTSIDWSNRDIIENKYRDNNITIRIEVLTY